MRLALTSSTGIASLCIEQNGHLHELENTRPREHSEFLNRALEEILKTLGESPTKLTAILVDEGPGSFTGVRAAVSFAKTLAYANQIPIFATSSLKLLLHQKPLAPLALINAHRNLYFCSRREQQTDSPPLLLDESQIIAFLSQLPTKSVIVGDGLSSLWPMLSEALRDQLVPLTEAENHPRARSLFEIEEKLLSTFDWKTLNPLYVRSSSAEEVLEAKKKLST